MTNWKKSFPSKYLQTADLEDGPIDTVILGWKNENIGIGADAELKPVLRLRSCKGLVLNITKCHAIEQIANSADMDDWIGANIRLQTGTTFFKGKSVDCIAIVAVPKAAPPVEGSGDGSTVGF